MRKLIKCSLRENLLSLSLLLGDKNFDENSRVEAHQIVEECLAMTRTEKAAVEVKALRERVEQAVKLMKYCLTENKNGDNLLTAMGSFIAEYERSRKAVEE